MHSDFVLTTGDECWCFWKVFIADELLVLMGSQVQQEQGEVSACTAGLGNLPGCAMVSELLHWDRVWIKSSLCPSETERGTAGTLCRWKFCPCLPVSWWQQGVVVQGHKIPAEVCLTPSHTEFALWGSVIQQRFVWPGRVSWELQCECELLWWCSLCSSDSLTQGSGHFHKIFHWLLALWIT